MIRRVYASPQFDRYVKKTPRKQRYPTQIKILSTCKIGLIPQRGKANLLLQPQLTKQTLFGFEISKNNPKTPPKSKIVAIFVAFNE
jgi:hypothetical protein